MDEPARQVEFEAMVLGRHGFLPSARERPDGRLERSAYVLLSRLQIDGPMSISQLSCAFGLDSSTLNRQTAAMTRAGLVERIPDPEGGIARKFRVTAMGEKRLDADREANVRGLERVLAGWTPEEVAHLAAALERLNRDIERLDGRHWPRP